jgi:HSP20 family molecular chaperone IbpA
MQNTNDNKTSGGSAGKSVMMALAILAVGLGTGIIGMKYVEHRGFSVRARDAVGIAGVANNGGSTSSAAGNSLRSDEWNPFKEMREMQAEMDQSFQRSFEHLRRNPKLSVFQEDPGYSLSLDVRDLKNHYEVRAFLPDTKASDVNVKLDGNQLKVDVTDKSTAKQAAQGSQATTTEWGQYQEVVRLPGALKDDQMKVERKEHELIITVPKA